jgi:hypothetical protein
VTTSDLNRTTCPSARFVGRGGSTGRSLHVGSGWRRLANVCLVALLTASGWAQTTLYWDTNGTTTGTGTGAQSGNWATNGGAGNRQRWTTSSAGTGTPGVWTAGSNAVFSAGTNGTGTQTVTLIAAMSVSSLVVEEGSAVLNSFAINFSDSTPDISVDTGSTLTLSVAPTSSTGNLNLGTAFNVAGGSPIVSDGLGTTVFSANTTLAGTVTLAGGTLRLSGSAYSFGTLSVTGNSTIDFAGAATSLSLSTLTIASGVTLTITNWNDAIDVLSATAFTGATQDTINAAPMNQISFSGYGGFPTEWQSSDNQVRPRVPEPSTYGALLLGTLIAGFWWRRRRSNPALTAPASAADRGSRS